MTTTPPLSRLALGMYLLPVPPASTGNTTTAGPGCWTCISAARISNGTPPSGSTGPSRDPTNVMEQSDELCPIYGSRQWDLLSQKERDELGHHLSAWLFSQFLHGEQGALTVAARIVESVPDMDSKFYAATQAMD